MSKPQLTVEDFVKAGIPAEKTELRTTGTQHVWYYLGNDLQEYVRHADVVLGTSDKFYDYANRRPGGAHLKDMDAPMALLLTAMCQITRATGKEVFVYPKDFPIVQPNLARGFSTNYNYLKHFGMCSKPTSGQYQVTPFGFKWFDGLVSCPEYVICSGENVLRESESRLYVHDLLGDIEQIREEPLWWEEANKV